MRELRILPGNISNMIAAGEVVLRPSSVVKELMENAVDAGATDIKVIIIDSGRTLIQVIDNGCGMSPDDAVLCFERHATSKISSADDLQDIMTFGFRGEALPSIAAVADEIGAAGFNTKVNEERNKGAFIMNPHAGDIERLLSKSSMLAGKEAGNEKE